MAKNIFGEKLETQRNMRWWNTGSISKSAARNRWLRLKAKEMVEQETHSNHSARGSTLAYQIEELEKAGVGYTIERFEGGIVLTSHPDRKLRQASFTIP